MSLPRLRTLRALAARDWALLAVASTLVVGVRAALWLLPSGTIVRAVRRLARPRPAAAPRDDARRVVWAVETVSRRVPGASCLTQAVAAQLLLRRRGLEAQLCLGVARGAGGRFRAHAWLEREGRILIGGDGVARLTRLPDLASVGATRWE